MQQIYFLEFNLFYFRYSKFIYKNLLKNKLKKLNIFYI